ncbi:unnamed protein product [Blepharisma stoltei]|uniref:Protein kinase domain-containing protein n=1 Tax=Blepharisma stoltei TaxID=1481888 RepID=A0AAU9I791_9CILI|nr:unnamed protein product [Blepharisma stoltei]
MIELAYSLVTNGTKLYFLNSKQYGKLVLKLYHEGSINEARIHMKAFKLCPGGVVKILGANSYNGEPGILLQRCRYTTEDYDFKGKSKKLEDLIKSTLNTMKILHDSDIVHRDLKPSNIFYHDGKFKIGDFGEAASINEEYELQINRGTKSYMSRAYIMHYEGGLWNGRIDAKKEDVWALGKTFLELLCGVRFPDLNRRDDNFVRKFVEEQLNKLDFCSNIKEAILGMLEPNQDKRLSMEDALNLINRNNSCGKGDNDNTL